MGPSEGAIAPSAPAWLQAWPEGVGIFGIADRFIVEVNGSVLLMPLPSSGEAKSTTYLSYHSEGDNRDG